jgi:hypothetical protein
MNAMDLEPLCYVEAATRDREKGIQRVTEVSRLKEIGEFLATGENSFLPNNIILNLKPEVLNRPLPSTHPAQDRLPSPDTSLRWRQGYLSRFVLAYRLLLSRGG